MFIIMIINLVNDCFPGIVQEFVKVSIRSERCRSLGSRGQAVAGSYLIKRLFFRHTKRPIFRTSLQRNYIRSILRAFLLMFHDTTVIDLNA